MQMSSRDFPLLDNMGDDAGVFSNNHICSQFYFTHFGTAFDDMTLRSFMSNVRAYLQSTTLMDTSDRNDWLQSQPQFIRVSLVERESNPSTVY